jgi:hypothetical protein
MITIGDFLFLVLLAFCFYTAISCATHNGVKFALGRNQTREEKSQVSIYFLVSLIFFTGGFAILINFIATR